jgi:hypothetical protein
MKAIKVTVYGRWTSYSYKTELRNLEIALNGVEKVLRGEMMVAM